MSIGTMFAFESVITPESAEGTAIGIAPEKCAVSPAGVALVPSKPLKNTPTAGPPARVR